MANCAPWLKHGLEMQEPVEPPADRDLAGPTWDGKPRSKPRAARAAGCAGSVAARPGPWFAGSDGRQPPANCRLPPPPGGAAASGASSVTLKPAELLRISDAAQAALLADWLQGCYTARPWTSLTARKQPQSGDVIYVPRPP
jgi:hypothetical protein